MMEEILMRMIIKTIIKSLKYIKRKLQKVEMVKDLQKVRILRKDLQLKIMVINNKRIQGVNQE